MTPGSFVRVDIGDAQDGRSRVVVGEITSIEADGWARLRIAPRYGGEVDVELADCEPARRPAWLRSTTTIARIRPGVYSIRRDGREVATVEGTRADAWAKVRDLDKAAG